MDALENFGEAFKGLGGDIVKTVTNIFKTAEAGGVTSGQFTVNPANVMAAAKIIDDQAENLATIYENCARRLRITPPGGDQISQRMALAWNDLLVNNEDSYAARVAQYVVALKGLVTQLEEAAKNYGYTDEQVAAALRKTSA